MQIAHFILPAISAIVLVFIYIIILATRAQKTIQASGEPVLMQDEASRSRERFWWSLTMAIVLATILGFASLLSLVSTRVDLKNALGVGLIIWIFLIIVGRRLTS